MKKKKKPGRLNLGKSRWNQAKYFIDCSREDVGIGIVKGQTMFLNREQTKRLAKRLNKVMEWWE